LVSPLTLEVVTPYLRPGVYKLQLKAAKGVVVQSEVTFTSVPSDVDKEFDRVSKPSTGARDLKDLIELLKTIASSNKDFQVRAFARYQAALLYFAATGLVALGSRSQ